MKNAELIALVAQMSAKIAALEGKIAAQPAYEPSPASYRIATIKNAESGKVSTILDFRNHSDKPIVIPAGCEVSFWANGAFEGGHYLKPKGEPKPLRKQPAPTAPAPADAEETIDA